MPTFTTVVGNLTLSSVAAQKVDAFLQVVGNLTLSGQVQAFVQALQFGSSGAVALVSGSQTLSLPVKCKYWHIDNQSANTIKVSFPPGSGFNNKILNPNALGAGYTGDSINSIGFPIYSGIFTLTGTGSGQFSCGATDQPPLNHYRAADLSFAPVRK